MTVESFFSSVSASVGPSAVDRSPEANARYGRNTLPGGDRQPAAAVFPASVEDVQTIVRLAGEHGVTLWPTSTGHNHGLGEFSPVREGQVVMHLGKRMNRILEIDEELCYAVLEPGVTFRALRAELARRGDTLMLSGTSGPADGGVLGNALDRGAGYTPYFDHFGMTCGIEAVLPDGSIFRTGDGGVASDRCWHINKSAFGPLVDGMFSQSNLGIVTRLGIWLMPRPPAIRSFFFTFPDDEDLEQIIDLVRPLKLNNVVPTTIKVTSSLYGLGTKVRYPFDRTGGATPLPSDVRKELEREEGTGAWIVSGAFYGPDYGALDASIDRVKAHFMASGKATYISHEEALDNPIFKIHIDTFSGEPTDSELGLTDWRPGGGMTWFLPTTPMIGSIAQEHQALSQRLLAEHGFDYMTTFVCGPRGSRALHVIIFNREDPEECARMRACYRAAMEAYDKIGYPFGRMPTDFHEEAMARLPEMARLWGAIKHALDPGGVIAPGKYGIVPAAGAQAAGEG